MTLTETIIFQAVAAAGVALLVGLAWALGFRAQTKIVSLDPYAKAADVTLTDVAISSDGHAALGLSSDGRVLIAKAMGDDVAVRVAPVRAIQSVAVKGDRVRIAFDDFGFPELVLRISTPPLWLGRLAQ